MNRRRMREAIQYLETVDPKTFSMQYYYVEPPATDRDVQRQVAGLFGLPHKLPRGYTASLTGHLALRFLDQISGVTIFWGVADWLDLRNDEIAPIYNLYHQDDKVVTLPKAIAVLRGMLDTSERSAVRESLTVKRKT